MVEVAQSEINELVQLREDSESEETSENIIADQLDQEDDTLDAEHKINNADIEAIDAEKQAEQDDFAWAQGQLPTPDLSILEVYLTDLFIPTKSQTDPSSKFSSSNVITDSAFLAHSAESERVVSDSLAFILHEVDSTPIEPAILAEL